MVLFAGSTGQPQEMPKAMGVDEENETVPYSARYILVCLQIALMGAAASVRRVSTRGRVNARQ